MEKYVKDQKTEVAKLGGIWDSPEGDQEPEKEELPSGKIDKVGTMKDLVDAIKSGDKQIEESLIELAEKFMQFCDNMSDVQSRIANVETILESYQQSNVVVHEMSNRIANIETILEAQQLSNIGVRDKLAKIGEALVAFVAKFGAKKDEAKADDGADAEKEGG